MKFRTFCLLCWLVLIGFGYADSDRICDITIQFPAPTIENRVINRGYPSIFQAGGVFFANGLPAPTSKEGWFILHTKDEYIAKHDLVFNDFSPYGVSAVEQPASGLSNQVSIADVEIAKFTHGHRLKLNPNHLFLIWDDVHIGEPEFYPKNIPDLWLRDADGERFEYNPGDSFYLNILNPMVRHTTDISQNIV